MNQENFSKDQFTVEQKKPINQVTPLSKYLLLILLIILPFIGGYVGYNFAPEKIVEIEKVVIKEIATENGAESGLQKNKSNYSVATKTYQDNDLGIIFDYPSFWGEIIISDERGNCHSDYLDDDCNFRKLIFFKEKDISPTAIFLSSKTKGHHNNPIGRGGFWGDFAGHISSNYLAECVFRQDCRVVENSNSVTFAVYDADPPPEEMGYQPERYYVYNPNSQYYGLALSSHRLGEHSPENNSLFKEIIIESFKFTK